MGRGHCVPRETIPQRADGTNEQGIDRSHVSATATAANSRRNAATAGGGAAESSSAEEWEGGRAAGRVGGAGRRTANSPPAELP